MHDERHKQPSPFRTVESVASRGTVPPDQCMTLDELKHVLSRLMRTYESYENRSWLHMRIMRSYAILCDDRERLEEDLALAKDYGKEQAKERDQLREKLAHLEEESRQWEKTSLVEIVRERDEYRREAMRMTDLWRKTNDEYQRVSKALCRLQETERPWSSDGSRLDGGA